MAVLGAPSALQHAAPLGGSRPALTCAFGGGGAFGIAYAFGIADALVEAGVPMAGSSFLGTSAGAWVGACLATGVPFSELRALPVLRVPNLRPGALQRQAARALGDLRSDRLTAVALRLRSGRRTTLSGGAHRLADVVAASSAVPWLFAPVRVGRQRYVDGGVRSLVSADLAPPADHLLAIAPIAGPMFGPAGQTMEVLLRRELRRWQDASGGTAHLIRPNHAIAGLARRPLDLFDSELAAQVYPMARAQAERLISSRSLVRGFRSLDGCLPPGRDETNRAAQDLDVA